MPDDPSMSMLAIAVLPEQ